MLMITVSLVKCVLNSPKTTPVILHSLKYDSRHTLHNTLYYMHYYTIP